MALHTAHINELEVCSCIHVRIFKFSSSQTAHSQSRNVQRACACANKHANELKLGYDGSRRVRDMHAFERMHASHYTNTLFVITL